MASDWNGLPENPAVDGWHLLWCIDRADPESTPDILRWHAASQWFTYGRHTKWMPHEIAREWEYRGALHTTTDLAARVEAERVACIAVARDDRNIGIGGDATAGMIANAIRALGPTPAFDAAIKAAEARASGLARETALKDAAAHLLRAFPPSVEREAAVSLFQQIGEEAAIHAAAGGRGMSTNIEEMTRLGYVLTGVVVKDGKVVDPGTWVHQPSTLTPAEAAALARIREGWVVVPPEDAARADRAKSSDAILRNEIDRAHKRFAANYAARVQYGPGTAAPEADSHD